MDLSKVTFPTFVLEPRSMLERITDFMAHPDLIFGWVVSLLYSALAASRHPRAPLTQQHMLLLGSAAPDLTLSVNLVSSPVPVPVPAPVSPERLLILLFVIFAVQSYAKNLKNVLYAFSNITSQVGISNQRVSRSRKHIPLPTLSSGSISYASLFKRCRYNPVLGEFFRCRYDYTNGTQGFYIAEQGLCAFVCVCACATIRFVLIRPVLFFSLVPSLTPSTYIRLLLCFTCEQGRRRRRASTKVQVPWQFRLDGDGGLQSHITTGSPRRLR